MSLIAWDMLPFWAGIILVTGIVYVSYLFLIDWDYPTDDAMRRRPVRLFIMLIGIIALDYLLITVSVSVILTLMTIRVSAGLGCVLLLLFIGTALFANYSKNRRGYWKS